MERARLRRPTGRTAERLHLRAEVHHGLRRERAGPDHARKVRVGKCAKLMKDEIKRRDRLCFRGEEFFQLPSRIFGRGAEEPDGDMQFLGRFPGNPEPGVAQPLLNVGKRCACRFAQRQCDEAPECVRMRHSFKSFLRSSWSAACAARSFVRLRSRPKLNLRASDPALSA